MARAGKMYEKEIDSIHLHEKINLRIYEPEEIDSLYETNVCIVQDGNDYYNLGRLATVSDQLHDSYDIVNTIFVGIHYKDRFERRERYHPQGKENKHYELFIVEEVIALLKDIVPLNPLGITYSLMGDSLAGTFAFMTAVKHDTIFKNIIMQSPLVNEDVLELAKKSDSISRLNIYHTIGLKESAVPTTVDGEVEFVQPNKDLHHILKDKMSNYYYDEFPHGEHTWKYWQEDLPHALTTIFA